MSARSRSNWNWKCWFLRRGETESKYPEKNVSEQGRKPTTISTHIWRQCQDSNPRATLVGGEREIHLLKEPRDEGVKNTCSSSRIHFVLLFLLVDELPNESVERNSHHMTITSYDFALGVLRLTCTQSSLSFLLIFKREKRWEDAVILETFSIRFFSLQ